MRHLKRKMDITRRLMEAERAVEDTNEAACIIGVVLQSQTYGSESESGQWVEDQGQVHTVLSDKDVGIEDRYHTEVVSWLETHSNDPYDFDHEGSGAVAYDTSKRDCFRADDVEVWESESAVVRDWRGRKICEWRQRCEAAA